MSVSELSGSSASSLILNEASKTVGKVISPLDSSDSISAARRANCWSSEVISISPKQERVQCSPLAGGGRACSGRPAACSELAFVHIAVGVLEQFIGVAAVAGNIARPTAPPKPTPAIDSASTEVSGSFSKSLDLEPDVFPPRRYSRLRAAGSRTRRRHSGQPDRQPAMQRAGARRFRPAPGRQRDDPAHR